MSNRSFSFRLLLMNLSAKPFSKSVYQISSPRISSVHLHVALQHREWIKFLFPLSGTKVWKFVYCSLQVGSLLISSCRDLSGFRFSKTSVRSIQIRSSCERSRVVTINEFFWFLSWSLLPSQMRKALSAYLGFKLYVVALRELDNLVMQIVTSII